MAKQPPNSERLPIVTRQLEADESIRKLGSVASTYGYSLHAKPSYALLTRPETEKFSHVADPAVIEAIGSFAMNLSDDPIDMRVKNLRLWTRGQKRRVALRLYHTTQTLEERRSLIELIQEKTGVHIPDELKKAEPEIGIAISRKRIVHDRTVVNRHLESVRPLTVRVSKVVTH